MQPPPPIPEHSHHPEGSPVPVTSPSHPQVRLPSSSTHEPSPCLCGSACPGHFTEVGSQHALLCLAQRSVTSSRCIHTVAWVRASHLLVAESHSSTWLVPPLTGCSVFSASGCHKLCCCEAPCAGLILGVFYKRTGCERVRREAGVPGACAPDWAPPPAIEGARGRQKPLKGVWRWRGQAPGGACVELGAHSHGPHLAVALALPTHTVSPPVVKYSERLSSPPLA